MKQEKDNKNGHIRQYSTPTSGASPRSNQVGRFLKGVLGDLVAQELEHLQRECSAQHDLAAQCVLKRKMKWGVRFDCVVKLRKLIVVFCELWFDVFAQQYVEVAARGDVVRKRKNKEKAMMKSFDE